MTRFDETAEEHGVIAVYPDAWRQAWAVDGSTPADLNFVDDVVFMRDLIDEVSSNYSIDPKRVYAAGISNGGRSHP